MSAESTPYRPWIRPAGGGFPVGERVAESIGVDLHAIRVLTDLLDNIDVFVEEHGLASVHQYLRARFADSYCKNCGTPLVEWEHHTPWGHPGACTITPIAQLDRL